MEFFNPATGTLRYTLNDDVRFMRIEEHAGDEADDATLEIANPGGVHTSQFFEGDEVRVSIQLEGEGALSHIWTGTVDTVRSDRQGSTYSDIKVSAQDWVYYKLAHTYVTDTFEDQAAGEIVRAIVQNEASAIDVTNVEDTTTDVPSLSFNGLSLLQAIRRVAELAGAEWHGDKDKRLHFFEKGTRASGAHVDASKVVRGTFRVETSMANFGNLIRIRGGERAQLDKQNTTFSAYSSLTGATRKKARVYVSKANVNRVELYTSPDGSNQGDLRVRIQADNEAGTDPIEEANADRDLAGRTLSQEFLTVGGWTAFILPDNVVPPGGYVWLIVECATDGESQRVGVDGSGNLLYKTHYPVPIIVERMDQTSVDTYGRVELPPVADRNIATEDEATLLADARIARASTPQRNAEYELAEIMGVNLAPSSWWKFNEGSGTNVNDDATGGVSDLTLGTGVSWTTSGVTLDDDEYIAVTNQSKFRSQSGVSKSMNFDIMPTQVLGGHSGANLFSSNNNPGASTEHGWYFYIDTNRRLRFAMQAATVTEEATGVRQLTLSERVNVGFAYDGASKTVRIFINGVLDKTYTFTNPTALAHNAPTGNVTIGGEDRTSLNSEWPYIGDIYGISFFEASLTDNEMKFLAGSGDYMKSLDMAALGETAKATFTNDGVAADTPFIVLSRKHEYDAERGTYSLKHTVSDAERIRRVENLLASLQERVQRVEGSAMGEAKGEIVDLVRYVRDTAKVADVVTQTETAAGSFVVGTAIVGFSSVT